VREKQTTNLFDNDGASSSHKQGKDYDKFLDISKIHKDGIKKKQDWMQRGITLAIPNAELSCDNLTNSTFIVKDENGYSVSDKKAIGYSAEAVIELKPNISLTVEANDSNKKVVFSKTFPPNQDLTVKFDNDCPYGPPTETTDFEMLYDVLEDSTDLLGKPPKRFVVERVEKAPFKESSLSSLWSVANDLSKIELFGNLGLSGIFKLFNTNLEPNKEGVPCHMCISSDSSKLP
jgi:hypothetical protein